MTPVDHSNEHDSASSGVARLSINTEDWSYLAEGGFHIILRYVGSDRPLQNKILRIAKKSLVHTTLSQPSLDETKTSDSDDQVVVAAALNGSTSSNAPPAARSGVLEEPASGGPGPPSSGEVTDNSEVSSKPPISVMDEASVRSRFERVVLVPLIGAQYVQPGDAVGLTRKDIEDIHHRIDFLRPQGRIRNDAGNWSSAAQLEPDKTSFWLDVAGEGLLEPPLSGEESVVIAVEIKPKSSTMPVASLVPPGPNRLKYRINRFDAQQRFKAQRKQSWGTIRQSIGYHPLELFSGDAQRTAATLKELLKTPQNKLRAWENGAMLFGVGSGTTGPRANAVGMELLEMAVTRAGLDDGKGAPGDALMDLIGEILTTEPLVANMMAVEALDVLSVEGAAVVFQKLVSLCGGSEDAALDVLEQREADPFEPGPVPPQLVLPQEILSSLRAGPTSRSTLEGRFGAELDKCYRDARQAVDDLCLEDCVRLLRRYIVSLGVKDCSVMMSLKAVEGQSGAASSEASRRRGTPQGTETAGVLVTRDGRRVAYCLSVVDAGPKPATKVTTKARHEDEIWDFVAGLGDGVFL